MTDILRKEITQNIQIEKDWLHNWGKSLRILFFVKSKLYLELEYIFYVGIFGQ